MGESRIVRTWHDFARDRLIGEFADGRRVEVDLRDFDTRARMKQFDRVFGQVMREARAEEEAQMRREAASDAD